MLIGFQIQVIIKALGLYYRVVGIKKIKVFEKV